jgi:Tfp pilus assembly protein PilV
MRKVSKGFSLIEALASVVLIAVGYTATISCLGAFSRAQARSFDHDRMESLALQKYDELIGMSELQSGTDQGDFQDVGETRFTWRAERVPLGIGNLDSIQIDVAPQGGDFSKGVTVQGLICRPVTSSTGGSS